MANYLEGRIRKAQGARADKGQPKVSRVFLCSPVPDGLAACVHAAFSIRCPPWIHDLMDVNDIRVSGNL